MKSLLPLIGAVLIISTLFFYISNSDSGVVEMARMPSIHPVSHASAVLAWGDTVIYSDPVGDSALYEPYGDPDIIFVTHEHGDHFDLDTLSAVVTNDTLVLLPPSVAAQVGNALPGLVQVLENGQSSTKDDITITAVPAYNVREEALERHPKGRDNGYVIERDGVRVYFSGDTEGTPEMKALENIDIAFVAMNLPYTMGVEAAAEAVLAFEPKHVYPYHYRTPDGFSDVTRFKSLVDAAGKDIEVVLRDWYKN